MNSFRVSFLVHPNKLGVILGVIQKEVSDLSITEDGAKPKITRSRSRSPGGVTALTQLGLDFCTKLGSGKSFSTMPKGEMGKFFVAAGKKASNTSPVCTTLARMNKIIRTGRGKAKTV